MYMLLLQILNFIFPEKGTDYPSLKEVSSLTIFFMLPFIYKILNQLRFKQHDLIAICHL